MEFVRVGVVALLGVMIAVSFKGGRQEYGIYLGGAICLLIFTCTVAYMGQAESQLGVLWGQIASGGRYAALLLKVVGITWICEFVAGICRDSGFSAVASQVELFGKIAILFAGMPVFLALAETIAGFVG